MSAFNPIIKQIRTIVAEARKTVAEGEAALRQFGVVADDGEPVVKGKPRGRAAAKAKADEAAASFIPKPVSNGAEGSPNGG